MMCEGLRTAGASCIVVLIVLNVPAFAQTDTVPRMLALERSAAGIVREYVPPERAAHPPELPPNLRAPSFYRQVLESMLQHSPSFRLQCRRIANAPLAAVQIQQATRSLHGASARTQILRRPDGALEATIEIARLVDAVELIAHEIEHVIEQLDEVDLPARAEVAGSGVRLGAGDKPIFETTRAIRIGRKVALEVRRGGG